MHNVFTRSKLTELEIRSYVKLTFAKSWTNSILGPVQWEGLYLISLGESDVMIMVMVMVMVMVMGWSC